MTLTAVPALFSSPICHTHLNCAQNKLNIKVQYDSLYQFIKFQGAASSFKRARGDITCLKTLFSAPSIVCLRDSAQPHDQSLLPLATAELNLKLEHSQGKTIKQPHRSQDSAQYLSAYYHTCYHTQTLACHVTIKSKSADAPPPYEVAERLEWMLLLIHCRVCIYIGQRVTGLMRC